MTGTRTYLCNGANLPSAADAVRLDYRPGFERDHAVRIKLPTLVSDLLHIPARLLDLLEIASYVYCVDRVAHRGRIDSVEYQSWSRDLRIAVAVRDYDFWASGEVADLLAQLLSFLSGDRFELVFSPGHKTPAVHLFDATGTPYMPADRKVALFSGGLDSTTGALELLSAQAEDVLLVSHQPASTSAVRSQKAIATALSRDFDKRAELLSFVCSLTGGVRAADENQRTRFFLYASIAAAISLATGSNNLFAFENGVTSINLPRRQDLMNARSTRTTHPATMRMLRRLLQLVSDSKLHVLTPYEFMTKTDVLTRLKELGGAALYDSTVSCSKTYRAGGGATHCGGCSQCIDRRFAAYAAGLVHEDEGTTYGRDFLTQEMEPEERGVIVTYFAQATDFATQNADWLALEHLDDFAAVADGYPELGESELSERIWGLLHRHGMQVKDAYQEMRTRDDPMRARTSNCVFDRMALQIDSQLAAAPSQVKRQLLATMTPPLFDPTLNEWQANGTGFVQGFFRLLHPEGSHPGLSQLADATFRLHLVLLVVAHYVRKFDSLRENA